jgi:hypothetical protein
MDASLLRALYGVGIPVFYGGGVRAAFGMATPNFRFVGMDWYNTA